MSNKMPILRNFMTFESKIRYLAWRKGLFGQKPITVQLKNGLRLIIRPEPSTDLSIAYEIFISQVYKPLGDWDSNQIRKIVDIGSNVGYSVLYFSRKFPCASIEAFEPHPKHIAQLKQHIKLNHLENIVEIHEVAVSNQKGNMLLTDSQVLSKLVEQETEGCIRVSVVDWLSLATRTQIDLLKIDIEGGEYPIIFDSRFANLNIKNLMIEWHATPGKSPGKKEVWERLDSLNYRLFDMENIQTPQMEVGVIFGSMN